MVKFHLISTAILAIASVAPWTATALPVDTTSVTTTPSFHANGHPIITNPTYGGSRKQNLHPGAGASLRRRGNEEDQDKKSSGSDDQGEDEQGEFPGKGHHWGQKGDEFPGNGHHWGQQNKTNEDFPGKHHGHNKTEGEFPGKGHHWGHNKTSEDFPGKHHGHGNSRGQDDEQKPTPSFPLTALPKPSNGGDIDMSDVIEKLFPSGVPKSAGDISDIIKKIFPSGLPSGFPDAFPSNMPMPTDIPSDGGKDDDEKKSDEPAPTTTPQATTTTVKAKPSSSATTSAKPEASSSSSSGSGSLSKDDAEALDLHNQFRAKHSAPALVWNDKLASYAQDWSNRCVFEHSSGPYGENLAMGYGDWKSAITAWYDEVSDYDYSNPGFASGTGHFTQVVWVGTTELGCGVAQCSNGPMYTCSYQKPGNIVSGDEFKKNVLPN